MGSVCCNSPAAAFSGRITEAGHAAWPERVCRDTPKPQLFIRRMIVEKPDWPWQERGVADTKLMLSQGCKSIVVTSPTGMGKGRQIEQMAKSVTERDGKVILFTNRRLLTRQTGDRFARAGINFGYISAEHGHCSSEHNMIIASLQTVASRVKRKKMDLPPSDLILIDEAHNRGFDTMIDAYESQHPGTAIVGYTASPVGLKGVYKNLIIAGTKKEGRQHGALVPAMVFAPSEPDMQGVKMTKIGEYEHKGMVKRVMQCTAFSDVFDGWNENGGDERPTLLWAPGVPESRWFVNEFIKRGINAAHIDGETSEDDRLRIAEGSRSGAIKIVSSFGVLREGVDWPWISYGILVQVCGAFSTFVQTVGRILRACPETGKTDAILQDHSGTWWRHGSPNEDYAWKLDCTNKSIAKKKKADVQDGKKAEGICCPMCGGIRAQGPTCPHCGYAHTTSVRAVRFSDGTLKKMKGSVIKKRKITTGEQKNWIGCLYAAARSGRTLMQAKGMYHKKFGSDLPANVYPQPGNGDPNWNLRTVEVYGWLGRRRKA